jgi:tetratricopeptide (TPR) repeat protein/tRNA A-37 threonylcarbamoyl transferase component Bud32
LEPTSKVIRILEDYLEELENGGQPRPDELLALHPEVAEPLRACLTSLNFLHEAALNVGTLNTPGTAGKAGTSALGQLGDYRIIREVGRGGMGVVYEAEQVSLGRRVALKVLPFAAALDQRQLQRFIHEAKAVAHLHHTNIVPVLSVGTERGVHYYAMQFIEGQPLSAIIRELSGAAEDFAGAHNAESTYANAALTTQRTKNKPEFFRKVAQLGVQAAEALEHAHRMGILHRDIKPANLLLDLRGNLWIADFGLARFPADTGLTLTGDVLGTLRYMSPEQALAKHGLIDHRTDIYGLGVTLYELLTLKGAFDGRDREEILQQLALEEPAPLRAHDRHVPAELETIVQKAIAKHPDERYSSAQELASDLRRFLEDKPILARRPTIVQRLRKWRRRHKPLVAAAVILLVLSVVVLAISTTLIWRAERLAETERQRAEQHFAQALETVNRMSRTIGVQRDPPGNLELEKKALAEEALNFYLQLLHEKEADPDLRFKTAQAYSAVASARDQLGDLSGSEDSQRKAIDLLSGLTREFPADRTYRSLLAVAKNYLGAFLRSDFSRHQEAEESHLAALALYQSLSDESTQTTEYALKSAETHHALGYLYFIAARTKEAEESYRRALEIFQDLSARFQHVDTRDFQARVYNSLGVLLLAAWRIPEAEAAHHKALKLIESRKVDSPQTVINHPERKRALGRLATLWWQTGKLEEADHAYREVVADEEKKIAELPQAPGPRFTLSLLLRQHGGVLEALGRPQEALDQYRQAITILKGLDRDFPPSANHALHLGLTHYALANLRFENAPQESRSYCGQALKALLNAVELDPKNPDAHFACARFMANSPVVEFRNPARAVELAKRALELTPGDPNIWNSLGMAQYRAGRWNEALVALQKSAELRQGGTALDHFFLAMAYAQLGDNVQASLWYERGKAWLSTTRREKESEYRRVRAETEHVLGVPSQDQKRSQAQ